MTTPEDSGASRAKQVLEVYGAPDEPRASTVGDISPRALGLAGVVAVSHGVALLAGHYALALAILLAALAGVAVVVTDCFPSPHRGEPR